ncbi:MAG: glycosyltransferase family A protein [Bacteroidota bacterium]
MPLISVLTPAYNREKYIGEAIESVQAQAIADWEIIIVDDGSTDKTIEIVRAYQAEDQRIILLQNPQNLGISATRNHGLRQIKGKYVAMLDSDDVFLPNKFQRQIEFLEAHPEIGVLGTWAQHIGRSNRQFTPEELDGQLRARSLYRCPLVHSSTIIRTSVIEAGNIRYNENYPASNDYDFWVKALPYAKFHNLQEHLVQYRKHDQNISVTNRSDQKKYRVASSRLAFKNVLDWEIEEKAHESLFNVLTIAAIKLQEVTSIEATLTELLERASQHPDLDLNYLKRAIFKKFMDAFQNVNLPSNQRLQFIRRHQVWKYLPLKTYAGTYGKLVMKEILRTAKRK